MSLSVALPESVETDLEQAAKQDPNLNGAPSSMNPSSPKVTHADRPIFIVGHARGGSTVLAAMLCWHSHVGPKPSPISEFSNAQHFIEAVLDSKRHMEFSSQLEQKTLWFEYLKDSKVFTDMGKEMRSNADCLSEADAVLLKQRLFEGLDTPRFLSKSPTNSFRLPLILKMYPDAKIVAIVRTGEQVVASWGRRRYGFGKPVEWGGFVRKKLSYREGINVFSSKWYETLCALKEASVSIPIKFVSYDSLVESTAAVLKGILDFTELPYEPYIEELSLCDNRQKWIGGIPWQWRWYLRAKVKRGNSEIRELC